MRLNRIPIVALLLLGCSHPTVQIEAPAQQVKPQLFDTGAFLHDQHLALTDKKLECKSCHLADPAAAFALVRPGASQHAPCDDCHRQSFYEAPGKLCDVCHARIDPLTKGQSPLRPYPARHESAELVSEFDHQLHLDPAKMKLTGTDRCTACHRVASDEEAYASFPVHADCVGCHAAPKEAKPEMSRCAECHARSGPGQGRHFLKNDIRFTHGKHRRDQAGRPVECERCHHELVNSTSVDQLALPKMTDCKTCHDDQGATPERVRISSCGVCHMSDVGSAPIPGDHTR
jgi:hypothetical protein